MARILLIDDDADLAGELSLALEANGHLVTHLERAERAPDLLAAQPFDLVLLDNKMPGMSGIEFLALLRQRDFHIPVILMTSFATADSAIQAGERDAFAYLEKPDDYDKLFAALTPLIAKALEIDWRPRVVKVPGDTVADGAGGARMLGKCKAILEVSDLIGRVAPSNASVLILGETGTGKDLVARAIHTHSPRKNRPFVALNCTALTETLLDAELFGHEKGAFTGADKLRKGRFEHADGGTLFLDEIGDMPLVTQKKILRVLENQEIERVGAHLPIKVDVRVVSATHRDLEKSIRAGTFREDLYYRLNGVTIRLPALRERGADLQLLVNHFLDKAAEGTGRRVPVLHLSAWEQLRSHPWPGNIRELRNVIGRAVLTARGSQIQPADLELRRAECGAVPSAAGSEEEALAGLRQAVRWAWDSGDPDLWPRLRDLLERELLRHALVALDGNKSQVAERLNMNRGTVIKRLEAYGLD